MTTKSTGSSLDSASLITASTRSTPLIGDSPPTIATLSRERVCSAYPEGIPERGSGWANTSGETPGKYSPMTRAT